jgi:hypothetical protein
MLEAGGFMVEQIVKQDFQEASVTVEDVQRVLELGRLLLSVLTPEELEQLRLLLNGDMHEVEKVTLVSLDAGAGSS